MCVRFCDNICLKFTNKIWLFKPNLTHSEKIYGAHCYYSGDKDHTSRIHDGRAPHRVELYAMCTHNYHSYCEMNPFEERNKKRCVT